MLDLDFYETYGLERAIRGTRLPRYDGPSDGAPDAMQEGADA